MFQKKEYEAAIVAALKREQDKEMSLQAMAVENQAALHLVGTTSILIDVIIFCE